MTLTPREIDAALAEAIGCKRDASYIFGHGCGCRDDQGRLTQAHTKEHHLYDRDAPYYTAPTWETAGQLIEGLAANNPGWDIEIHTGAGFWIAVIDSDAGLLANVYRDTGPAAVAEAARLALGIKPPERPA